jgi:hypothetical protein
LWFAEGYRPVLAPKVCERGLVAICELAQSGLQVVGDLLGEHVGRRQVLRVLERLVAEPDQVEAHLVARELLPPPS